MRALHCALQRIRGEEKRPAPSGNCFRAVPVTGPKRAFLRAEPPRLGPIGQIRGNTGVDWFPGMPKHWERPFRLANARRM